MQAKTLKVCLFSSAIVLVACVQEGENISPPAAMALVNPASAKCVEDGYQLINSLSANGVSSEFKCYNPKTQKQCEQWDYFRGTCVLE